METNIKNKRPLEFVIELDEENEEDNKEDNEDVFYKTTYFYEDGTKDEIFSHTYPKNIELGRHYFIGDLYGQPVKDDREGL